MTLRISVSSWASVPSACTPRDGGRRWFYLYKDEKQLPDGRVMWLLTLCDCNALHKREKWLVEARNSAEAANRAKSSFLSRMSHDIRSPLNGILGMAKIAYDNAEDPEKVRDTMEKLTAAGSSWKRSSMMCWI